MESDYKVFISAHDSFADVLAAYNFDHITILFTNMPLQDQELCGRLGKKLGAILAATQSAKALAA